MKFPVKKGEVGNKFSFETQTILMSKQNNEKKIIIFIFQIENAIKVRLTLTAPNKAACPPFPEKEPKLELEEISFLGMDSGKRSKIRNPNSVVEASKMMCSFWPGSSLNRPFPHFKFSGVQNYFPRWPLSPYHPAFIIEKSYFHIQMKNMFVEDGQEYTILRWLICSMLIVP